MVKTYNEGGEGRIKAFFVIDNSNVVTSVIMGDKAIPTEQGFQVYVDNYVADQIDKCELYLDGFVPKLKVREGETLEVPEKTEKEKEIERLKQELEKLMNDDLS